MPGVTPLQPPVTERRASPSQTTARHAFIVIANVGSAQKAVPLSYHTNHIHPTLRGHPFPECYNFAYEAVEL
jgi:hypothetical protein